MNEVLNHHRKLKITRWTLGTLLGLSALGVAAWHAAGCTLQPAGSSWSTGYCAPDPSHNPTLFWDIGDDSIDVGGYSPIGPAYDTNEEPFWEIYVP